MLVEIEAPPRSYPDALLVSINSLEMVAVWGTRERLLWIGA